MCIPSQEEKLRLPKKFEPSQCLMTLRSNVRQLNMQFCALELAGNLCSAVFFISSSLFFAYWLKDASEFFTWKDTDGNELAGWERSLSCVSLVPVAKWAKFGKYADEAITFAGKLDD